jgi:Protein of unknown function (DUF1604)
MPMSPTVPPSSAGPPEQRPIYIPRQKRRGYDAAAAADADTPLNPAGLRIGDEAPAAATGGASYSSFASERAAAATMARPSSSIYTSSSSAGGITRKRLRTAQQQKNERFHGAFTGGFSAGYYNTVGSREGWEPTEYGASTASRMELPGQNVPQQSIHSFMDEQDHNEWGGPQGIRNEFVSADSVGAASAGASNSKRQEKMTDPFTVQFRSGIGEQLLRVLGWRGSSASSAAYVLDDAHTATKEAGKDDPSYLQILSTKRLRRIEMSQVQVKVPQPKLDLCGLGYEPFRDAPEFARHFQERRKRAKVRGAGGPRSNASGAYRTSDLYQEEDDDDAYGGDDRRRRRARSPTAGSRTYVSKDDDDGHDFVGTRSVGGFALLDDEDDAYDDIGSQGANNLEAFDTELDLDDEADPDISSRLNSAPQLSLSHGKPQQVPANEKSVQGIFSSWATSSLTPAGAGGETAVMSDGRPILPGFVLSATVTSGTKRYRGPDVPLNYEVSNHVFGPREHPLVYQALLHAERLQITEDTYQKSVREALRDNSVARSSQPTAINEGPIRAMSHKMASFAGVSKAMERRFTKASAAEATPSEGSTGEARVAVASPRSSEKATRTFATFVPSAMLCKRLGVPAPKNFELTSSNGRTKEESFFQNEVLSRLPASRDKVESSTKRDQEPTSIDARFPPSDQEALLAALNSQVPPQSPGDDRPPVALYKSIFEPSTNELEEAASDDGNRDARRLLRDEKTTRRSPTSASFSSSYTETAELGDSAPPRDGSTSLGAKDMTFTTGYTLEGAVDSTGMYRERENQQKESPKKMNSQAMSSDNEDASESTGSMGYSPNDRKSRKARKRKRTKRKEKKRKRAH